MEKPRGRNEPGVFAKQQESQGCWNRTDKERTEGDMGGEVTGSQIMA